MPTKLKHVITINPLMALGVLSLTAATSTLAAGAASATEKYKHTIVFATATTSTWTVPPGVYSIDADLQGAQGRSGQNHEKYTPGGKGGRITATLRVTPGEKLQIKVGGEGWFALGGYNGGGGSWSWGGGGGGASDIRIGNYTVADSILVAGGGGGAGSWQVSDGEWANVDNSGGDGSGGDGLPGKGIHAICWHGGVGNAGYGLGGTANKGGTGGYKTCLSEAAGNGSQGYGGGGGSHGGGGGGGWYGGGGGLYKMTPGGGATPSVGGGGGGGSGHADSSRASNVFSYTGVRDGSGEVSISYQQ